MGHKPNLNGEKGRVPLPFSWHNYVDIILAVVDVISKNQRAVVEVEIGIHDLFECTPD
jgi:hypothetical protein